MHQLAIFWSKDRQQNAAYASVTQPSMKPFNCIDPESRQSLCWRWIPPKVFLSDQLSMNNTKQTQRVNQPTFLWDLQCHLALVHFGKQTPVAISTELRHRCQLGSSCCSASR